MAFEGYHLEAEYGEEENEGAFIGYSPAHLLCMQTNPSLSLLLFLSSHNPIAFIKPCACVSYDNEDPQLCGKYCLHLGAQFSNSIGLLQILLQLDTPVTKKGISSDGKNPLAFCVVNSNFQHRWIWFSA